MHHFKGSLAAGAAASFAKSFLAKWRGGGCLTGSCGKLCVGQNANAKLWKLEMFEKE